MRLLDNLTIDEIAEKLGAKKGTIRNYLTDFKSKKSRKSCINLLQEIIKNELG